MTTEREQPKMSDEDETPITKLCASPFLDKFSSVIEGLMPEIKGELLKSTMAALHDQHAGDADFISEIRAGLLDASSSAGQQLEHDARQSCFRAAVVMELDAMNRRIAELEGE